MVMYLTLSYSNFECFAYYYENLIYTHRIYMNYILYKNILLYILPSTFSPSQKKHNGSRYAGV